MIPPFQNWYLNLIPLFPLVGFLINSAIALCSARRGTKGHEFFPAAIGCLFPALSFLFSVWGFLILRSVPTRELISDPLFTWLTTSLLEVRVAFLFDAISCVMTLVITGVGSLIHLYSIGYMKGDPSFARYFAYLNLFLFFMLVLVLGDNLLVLFVGWEGVGLCSYLLIGFWFTDAHKASCGKKAFVVNRIGDFGFLTGLFLIVYAFVSQSRSSEVPFLNYSFMLSHKEIFVPFATVIALALFAGATGKSAQIPLYIWLPDAMAGPTPVSALIHAATMVTAGIYMVARLFFLFGLSVMALKVIAGIGLATALVAALMAMTQYDIKKVLAYSTISQLGFMFLALGVGAPASAIFHVLTHAFFKAGLFLSAGSIIMATHHEQDIRKMGGLAKKMPLTFVAFLFATLAITGIPPFAGFFSKDEILWHTYQNAPFSFYLVALLTAGLTAFYMFRLFAYVFLGSPRFHEFHPVPKVMTVVVVLLGLLSLVGGFVGLPAVLGWPNYLQGWFSFLLPVESGAGHHPDLEFRLMLLSAGWAAGASLLGLGLYWKNLDRDSSFRSGLGWIYTLVERKFYVDEVYARVLVGPIYHLSRTVFWKGIDERLVDGLMVNGWSLVAGFGGRIISRVQTGILGNYLVYLGVGVVCLLLLLLK